VRSGNATASDPVATATAQVVRRDLVDREQFSGTLGYGATGKLNNHLSGTVTAEAAEGTSVDRGQQLYRIDAQPVFLWLGSVPAYRDLQTGVSDGDDVKELEENLLALGYANASNLTASGHFDSYDEAAVRRWQKAVGLKENGIVHLGQVLFEPAAVRIASWQTAIGGSATPGPIADITGTAKVVSLDLDARKQQLAATGAAVQVTLPDGKVANGHISEVGRVATTSSSSGSGSSAGSGSGGGSGSNQATIKVYVTLDDPKGGGDVEEAPVKVGLTRGTRKGVLAVPVNALLARPDGTYAVEVVRGTAHVELAVKTGLFAEGMVEISGEGITAGTTVVVPVS